MDLVSVIIPTFNRFNYLLNAINSVKHQTYKHFEIIVVNDCSTDSNYYSHNWNDINIIHLKVNSKIILGFGCAAYVRNIGIKQAKGKYIAFLDDDDIWFPNKLELQLNEMKKFNCKMSCTEGIIGNGPYNHINSYKKYNSEFYWNDLNKIFRKKKSNLINNGLPNIFNLDLIKIHNCIITSSVIIQKDILEQINFMPHLNRGEDYATWLNALKFTDCVYINVICFYYDLKHGDGQNY